MSTRVRRTTAMAVVLGAVTAFSIGAHSLVGGPDRAGAAQQPSRVVTTLVFPSQMLADSDSSSYPITLPYPPTEGAGSYVVPAGSRLVIQSAYAETAESYGTNGSVRRDDIRIGISSSYDYGPECPFPGRQRNYGLNVSAPVVTDEGLNEQNEQTFSEVRHADLMGPIFVEGGRTVVASAQGPGGNSEVVVMVILHGYLEPAVNPSNPPTPEFCT